MATITITCREERGWKDALEKYMSRASTRPHAFELVSNEYQLSVLYLKKAASKSGLLKSDHSLKCVFSEEEEQALECACIVYSRQGTPFTIQAFLDVASFFAEKDEDHP